MQIFDTHGHLNLDPLYPDWQTHWQKAQKHAVQKIFVPGTTIDTSKKALELAQNKENILAGVGIHPSEAAEKDVQSQLAQLDSLLEENIEVITGLGETGLDYYWLADDANKAAIIKKQQELFIGQITLANKHSLPISIHVRDKNIPSIPTQNNAYWDTLNIIEKHHTTELPWILHCVSGPTQYLQKAIELGAYVSFAGNITYPNAKQLREILNLVPNNRVLVETDAPYLPPQEFRGKICEPWMISKTATFIENQAEITNKKLWHNAQTVFNLL